jgi:hypothetical protein
MKTINRTYTKKKRLEIAARLKHIATLEPACRDPELSGDAKVYVQRVFRSYNAINIMDFLNIFEVNWAGASRHTLDWYVAELLNRLADELEAVK